MNERAIADWLQGAKRQLTDELPVSPVRTHLNEMYRILEEALCPNICAQARAALAQKGREEAAELGMDDPIHGVRCVGCED